MERKVNLCSYFFNSFSDTGIGELGKRDLYDAVVRGAVEFLSGEACNFEPEDFLMLKKLDGNLEKHYSDRTDYFEPGMFHYFYSALDSSGRNFSRSLEEALTSILKPGWESFGAKDEYGCRLYAFLEGREIGSDFYNFSLCEDALIELEGIRDRSGEVIRRAYSTRGR